MKQVGTSDQVIPMKTTVCYSSQSVSRFRKLLELALQVSITLTESCAPSATKWVTCWQCHCCYLRSYLLSWQSSTHASHFLFMLGLSSPINCRDAPRPHRY